MFSTDSEPRRVIAGMPMPKGMPLAAMCLAIVLGAVVGAPYPPQDTSCDGGCVVGPFKAVGTHASNMNGDYVLRSNSGGAPPAFSALSSDYDKGNVEYFETYSPLIETRYSQVFWTMMKAVPLPQALVERFAGKVMAITGWEGDQVFKGPPGQPDTSVPITWAYNHHYGHYLNGKDSVLEEVELQGQDDPNGFMGHGTTGDKVWTTRPADDDSHADSRFPASTVFATGNGGEYRKSFHSYPSGYAQLIESPSSWSIQPMQIDTQNRDGSMAEPGMPFSPGPYPRSIYAPTGTHAPRSGPDATYSGLLECPCTDRITRHLGAGSASAATTKVSATCGTGAAFATAADCSTATANLAGQVSAPPNGNRSTGSCAFGEKAGVFLAGYATGAPSTGWSTLAEAKAWCCAHSAACAGITYQAATYTARAGKQPSANPLKGLTSWLLHGGGSGAKFSFASGANSSLPGGCSLSVADDSSGATVHGFFNTETDSIVPCGGKVGQRKIRGTGSAGAVTMSLALDEATNTATIRLSGPSAVWFGAAMDASGMASQPYAIVVSGGTGVVSEHKLGVHAPGTILQPTVKVVSSEVSAGRRTVTLTRPITIADYEGDHFDFDVTRATLPYITAVGSGATYAYHKSHFIATLALFAEDDAPTCVCTAAPPQFGQTANGVLHYNASGTDGHDSTVGFGKHCVGGCPRANPNCSESSSLIAQKNPTCDVRAYVGGLGCGHHLYYLLDKNQSHLIPAQKLSYHVSYFRLCNLFAASPAGVTQSVICSFFVAACVQLRRCLRYFCCLQMKVRFYFQEYQPQQHKQLWRWHWQTAIGAGEYDVRRCAAGTPPEHCVDTLHAKIQVKDFASGACNYRSGLNSLTPACKPNSTVCHCRCRCSCLFSVTSRSIGQATQIPWLLLPHAVATTLTYSALNLSMRRASNRFSWAGTAMRRPVS